MLVSLTDEFDRVGDVRERRGADSSNVLCEGSFHGPAAPTHWKAEDLSRDQTNGNLHNRKCAPLVFRAHSGNRFALGAVTDIFVMANIVLVSLTASARKRGTSSGTGIAIGIPTPKASVGGAATLRT